MTEDIETRKKAAIEKEKDMCCKCGKKSAEPDHTCPYRDEINGDIKTLCDCCYSCMGECADEI